MPVSEAVRERRPGKYRPGDEDSRDLEPGPREAAFGAYPAGDNGDGAGGAGYEGSQMTDLCTEAEDSPGARYGGEEDGAAPARDGFGVFMGSIKQLKELTAEEQKEYARKKDEARDAAIGLCTEAGHAPENGLSNLGEFNDYIGSVMPMLDGRQRRELQASLGRMRKCSDVLMESCLPFVIYIMSWNALNANDMDELVGAGNASLPNAVYKYDWRRGRLTTYVGRWLKGAYRKQRKFERRGVLYIPGYMTDFMGHVSDVASLLKSRGVMDPCCDDVMKAMELPEKKRRMAEDAMGTLKTQALHIGHGDDDDGRLMDIADTDMARSPLEALEGNEERALLLKAVGMLGPRERAIVEMRFGLNGYKQMTLKEVGREVGLTRERVRQIERDTLEELRFIINDLGSRAGSPLPA